MPGDLGGHPCLLPLQKNIYIPGMADVNEFTAAEQDTGNRAKMVNLSCFNTFKNKTNSPMCSHSLPGRPPVPGGLFRANSQDLITSLPKDPITRMPPT